MIRRLMILIARLSTSKAVHKSYMSPVIAAAETFHEGGPSHPAFSESSVSYRWQGSLGFRAWVDCAEGGQWPKDFSPECCLLWCAPMSEIDMVQHLLFFSGFRCRCQQCGSSLSSVREGSGPPRRAAFQALASSPSSVIPTKMSREVHSSFDPLAYGTFN